MRVMLCPAQGTLKRKRVRNAAIGAALIIESNFFI